LKKYQLKLLEKIAAVKGLMKIYQKGPMAGVSGKIFAKWFLG